MNLSEWMMLLWLSVLWGGSFFFAEICLQALPPLTIVFLRVSLAALALLVVLRAISPVAMSHAKSWRDFLIMGLLNNCVPFTLIVWGQTYIASGLAAILNATTPLFTILLAHLLTQDEKIVRRRAVGVVIGFIGVAIMIGADLLAGFDWHVGGQLAVLGAACSYAFASIFGKRFRDIPPVATATGQLSASTLLLLPLMLLADRPWTLPTPGVSVWAAVMGIALLSTALAYILFFRILATAGAINLMLVTFLIPVSAILLGWFFLDETIGSTQFIGMGCVGLGLLAVDGRALTAVRRRLFSRPAA